MEKFWKALETELRTRGLNSTCYVHTGAVFAGIFQIEKEIKLSKCERANMVTGRFLKIKPAGGHLPHVLDVDEIWTGYDREGYDWSDNMGGIRIDCNGLNRSGAIQKIADLLVSHFNAYFA